MGRGGVYDTYLFALIYLRCGGVTDFSHLKTDENSKIPEKTKNIGRGRSESFVAWLGLLLGHIWSTAYQNFGGYSHPIIMAGCSKLWRERGGKMSLHAIIILKFPHIHIYP